MVPGAGLRTRANARVTTPLPAGVAPGAGRVKGVNERLRACDLSVSRRKIFDRWGRCLAIMRNSIAKAGWPSVEVVTLNAVIVRRKTVLLNDP